MKHYGQLKKYPTFPIKRHQQINSILADQLFFYPIKTSLLILRKRFTKETHKSLKRTDWGTYLSNKIIYFYLYLNRVIFQHSIINANPWTQAYNLKESFNSNNWLLLRDREFIVIFMKHVVDVIHTIAFRLAFDIGTMAYITCFNMHFPMWEEAAETHHLLIVDNLKWQFRNG